MQAAALLPSSAVRAPRLLVLANGAPLGGAFDAVVCSSGAFGASRFSVRAALQGDAAAWTAQTSIAVDVRMALQPGAGFVSLVQGLADTVTLDPIAGTLTLEGRDGSAVLMETPAQETFANRTASEIATVLAGRHGLAADVQATMAPAGRYWELEHDSLTLNTAGKSTTEWDLLVTLAQHEGFQLWVDGGTLHFRPPAPVPPLLLPVASCTSLRLERSLTLAGDIAVAVKSWHSRAGVGCTGLAQTSRGAGQRRNYVFVVPNLTQDAAQALAQQRLGEIAGHELTLHATMPGELSLTPRGLLQLSGSGTGFDTVFAISEVERRLHAHQGFTQTVRAVASLGD